MHDSASPPSSRRRSWSRHTSKATCGLIKPPLDPTSPVQGDTATPRSLPSPQRKQSLRERFFTVDAANAHLDKDRELKRRERAPYVPTHAASSFERTTTARQDVRHLPTSSTLEHEVGQYTTAPPREQDPREADSDYAAFVSQSEARDVAREMYGEHPVEERAPRRKVSNRVARRIVQYVKPPREDRG